MIILPEVATKLERILNGLDGYTNPLPYYFQVETEGFHIDHIKRPDQDGNFIPVFISSLGGQFNPVKGLKQATYSIPVVFYYPVRFKDDFYALGEFLEDVFVGSKLNYGTVSGSAVSNISVPQYGEIQNLDFQEFKKWVNSKYTKAIDVMEPYMSMQFTLFLSNAAPGYLYGNDIETKLTVTINGVTYNDVPVVFDDGSIQSNSQAQSEQELGTNESRGLPFGTSYGSSFRLYIKDDSTTENNVTTDGICMALLGAWFDGIIQTLDVTLKFELTGTNKTFTRKCFISSANLPILRGQILGITLSFSPKIEDEEE